MTAQGCAFHNAAQHRCEIQAAQGHDALPLACRQFPRVSVTDPRGASVTLSHYCPTALSLLETFAGELAIVTDAAAFPAGGEYVGLDARTSLPPALTPHVLMDWDSWWEWERLAVELFNCDEPPREIQQRLSRAVEHARTWKPGQGELITRVRDSFAMAAKMTSGVVSRKRLPMSFSPRRAGPSGPAERALLASHAFANWTAHMGEGLRTWLRSLETVVFLLEEDWTMREIDLWLRHYADPRLLARVWSAAEREDART